MKKKLLAIVLSLATVGSIALCSIADAGYSVNSEEKTESASTSSTTKVPKNWTKIYENEYYTTYVENTKMKTRGTGDGRILTVVLDRKYTPLGSQWLGEINKGTVEPNVLLSLIHI